MSANQVVIAYPNFIAKLGGAITVRHNAYSAWVQLHDRVIRLPLKEVSLALNDGIKVAEIAKTYAYRNH